MTEGGKWLVQNELLSQAFLQLVFTAASPFHPAAIEIMNLITCLGGALAVWILVRFSRLYAVSSCWPLLFYFSSGFLIYSCGHTEYYPLLLPAMFLYGWAAILYLRDKLNIAFVLIAFLLAAGLHFAMLIALPSLLLLPILKNQKKDMGSVLIWLVLLVPLVLIRNHPRILGYKAAGLSPAWNFLPWFPYEGMYRHYAVFQWGHWLDWIYAWTMRSWIFWPVIVVFCWGKRLGDLLNRERIFLLLYTLSFTFWSMLWHPDLGIVADWDLFAIESAPCLLLLISCFPLVRIGSFYKVLMVTACTASLFVNALHVVNKVGGKRFGYGAIRVETTKQTNFAFTVNGLNRPLSIPRIQEGVYRSKYIDQSRRQVHEMHIVIHPGQTTHITLD